MIFCSLSLEIISRASPMSHTLHLQICLTLPMCVGHMSCYVCGGQRTTVWSQFSPSTFIWLLEIKLMSPGISPMERLSLWTKKKKKKSHSFTFISTHGSYFVCLVFEAGFLFIELAVLELTL